MRLLFIYLFVFYLFMPSLQGLTFANASGLHANNVSGATNGCSESPFEMGTSDGNWTRVAFRISTAKGTVSLTVPTFGRMCVLFAIVLS